MSKSIYAIKSDRKYKLVYKSLFYDCSTQYPCWKELSTQTETQYFYSKITAIEYIEKLGYKIIEI